MIRTHLEELVHQVVGEVKGYYEDKNNVLYDLETDCLHSILQEVEAVLPEEKKLEYFCVCDCIPCKTDTCDKCELEIGDMKPGDLCREGDNSQEIYEWNAALSQVRENLRKLGGENNNKPLPTTRREG